MARKFFTKKKSDKVKAAALEQLRKTRAQFDKAHPDMLDGLKAKIEAAGGPENLQFKEAPSMLVEQPSSEPPQIDPTENKKANFKELIERARTMQETEEVQEKKGRVPTPMLTPQSDMMSSDTHVPIDRTKNLETILEFLKLTDSPDIRKKLKDIVTQSLH